MKVYSVVDPNTVLIFVMFGFEIFRLYSNIPDGSVDGSHVVVMRKLESVSPLLADVTVTFVGVVGGVASVDERVVNDTVLYAVDSL